ncbi:hypothetical protein [Phormidium pseudopriestleyi]|nr:hypothetical protein [Phormidium pseudopriestleyi]
MFAVREEEGAVGEELAALQWFEVAAQRGWRVPGGIEPKNVNSTFRN